MHGLAHCSEFTSDGTIKVAERRTLQARARGVRQRAVRQPSPQVLFQVAGAKVDRVSQQEGDGRIQRLRIVLPDAVEQRVSSRETKRIEARMEFSTCLEMRL